MKVCGSLPLKKLFPSHVDQLLINMLHPSLSPDVSEVDQHVDLLPPNLLNVDQHVDFRNNMLINS